MHEQGKQLLKYNGPTPPEGVHTYHVALYEQRAELMNAVPPSSRSLRVHRAARPHLHYRLLTLCPGPTDPVARGQRPALAPQN